MSKSRFVPVILALFLVSVAAISVEPQPVHTSVPLAVVAPTGLLPSIVHHSDTRTVEAYQSALASPEVLQAVPCTCGCAASLGHENNFDCYVDDVQSNTVSYSTHGIFCEVCQLITRDAVAGADAGMSDGPLRRMIIERYSYGS